MSFSFLFSAENVGSLKTQIPPPQKHLSGGKKKNDSLKPREGRIKHVCKFSGSNSQNRRRHWHLKEYGVLCLNQPVLFCYTEAYTTSMEAGGSFHGSSGSFRGSCRSFHRHSGRLPLPPCTFLFPWVPRKFLGSANGSFHVVLFPLAFTNFHRPPLTSTTPSTSTNFH